MKMTSIKLISIGILSIVQFIYKVFYTFADYVLK